MADEASFRLKLIDDASRPARKAAGGFAAIADEAARASRSVADLGGGGRGSRRLSSSLRSTSSEFGRFAGQARSAQQGAIGFGAVFKGHLLASAVIFAAKSVAKLGIELGRLGLRSARALGEMVMFGERARLALGQLAPEGDTGEGLFNIAKELSGRFGMDLRDTTESLQKLLASQFSTQLSTDILKMGADLRSIGAGAQEVQSAIVAISQIKGAGRLMGQELLQLANAGVSIQLIREEIGKLEGGKSVAEVIQLQEAGKIGADTAIAGILNAVKRKTGVSQLGEAGERFANSTIEGMIGRARSLAQLAAEKVGSAISGPLNRIAKRGLGFVNEFLGGERGRARIERIAASIKSALEFVDRQLAALLGPDRIGRFHDFFDGLEAGFRRAIELGQEFASGFIGELAKADVIDGGRSLLKAFQDPSARMEVHALGKELGALVKNLVELTDVALKLLGLFPKMASGSKWFANQWMRMFAGMDWSQMRRTGEAGLAITRDVVFADELQQRRKEAMFERGRKIFAGEPLEDEGKGQGKALADGLIAGMQEKRQDVWAEANRLAEAAIDGSRVGMDAHSPSRRAFKLGGFFGQGLAGGIVHEAPRVERAGLDIAQAPLRSAASSLGGVRQGAAVPSNTTTTTVDVGGISMPISSSGATPQDLEAIRQAVRQEWMRLFDGLAQTA